MEHGDRRSAWAAVENPHQTGRQIFEYLEICTTGAADTALWAGARRKSSRLRPRSSWL